MSCHEVELAYLANKNTGYSVKFELQVSNLFFYYKHVPNTAWEMLLLKLKKKKKSSSE